MQKNDIGGLIKTINDKLKVRADADLKHYRLTLAQSRVLAFLTDCGGQATQKEIEVFLGVSHPTVVGIVSRMVQNGYLTTWFDPTDRRNKNVQLTPQAWVITADMEQNIQANEQALLANLSPAEREQLRRMLLTIARNLD